MELLGNGYAISSIGKKIQGIYKKLFNSVLGQKELALLRSLSYRLFHKNNVFKYLIKMGKYIKEVVILARKQCSN